jgi:hypothetical protein
MLILLSGDFPGCRQSRHTAWTPHSVSGDKGIAKQRKGTSDESGILPFLSGLRGEGLLKTWMLLVHLSETHMRIRIKIA